MTVLNKIVMFTELAITVWYEHSMLHHHELSQLHVVRISVKFKNIHSMHTWYKPAAVRVLIIGIDDKHFNCTARR